MPGTEAAHDDAPQVLPQARQSLPAARAVGWPSAISGTRFWRTATTSRVIQTSVPQAPTVTLPLA